MEQLHTQWLAMVSGALLIGAAGSAVAQSDSFVGLLETAMSRMDAEMSPGPPGLHAKRPPRSAPALQRLFRPGLGFRAPREDIVATKQRPNDIYAKYRGRTFGEFGRPSTATMSSAPRRPKPGV